MHILHIDSSPRRESHSRRLSAAIVERLLEVAPGASIHRRDLGAQPLPHTLPDYAVALSTPATLAAPPEGSLDESERLIQDGTPPSSGPGRSMKARSPTMSRTETKTAAGGTLPPIGSRITDTSAPPDDRAVRRWIGPEASGHWTALRRWIDATYPGVFEPEWLYGGKNRGWTLRYRQGRAFCTLVPEYGRLSAVVVLGRAEREKFEARRYAWRPSLVKLYDEARAYIDGKWLALTLASTDDLHELMELLTMKRPAPSPGHPGPGKPRKTAAR